MTQEQEQKSLNLQRLSTAIREACSFNPDVMKALNVDANIFQLAEAIYDELVTAYDLAQSELTEDDAEFLESEIHQFKPIMPINAKDFRLAVLPPLFIDKMGQVANRLSFRARKILESIPHQTERKPDPEPTPTAKSKPPRQAVTQRETARIVGVAVRTIQDWEAGKNTPEGWPGRGNLVMLGAWATRRAASADMKRAVLNTVRVGDVDRFSKRDKQHGEWQDEMKRRATPLKQDETDEDNDR